MESRKFKDHPHAQACIIENKNGYKALQSYETIVIEINPEGWLKVITMCNPKTGELSHTTIRHIGWFMRELGFTYQLAKQLYEDKKIFNIYTGEVVDYEL